MNMTGILTTNNCKCFEPPMSGYFIKGNTYRFNYGADMVCVIDEKGDKIPFDDFLFLWYFES